METAERKSHWEKLYATKNASETSWFQASPQTSLAFLEQFHLPKTARIIDVGGGNSFLVDELLKRGYEHLTVLDISEKALEKNPASFGKKCLESEVDCGGCRSIRAAGKLRLLARPGGVSFFDRGKRHPKLRGKCRAARRAGRLASAGDFFGKSTGKVQRLACSAIFEEVHDG